MNIWFWRVLFMGKWSFDKNRQDERCLPVWLEIILYSTHSRTNQCLLEIIVYNTHSSIDQCIVSMRSLQKLLPIKLSLGVKVVAAGWNWWWPIPFDSTVFKHKRVLFRRLLCYMMLTYCFIPRYQIIFFHKKVVQLTLFQYHFLSWIWNEKNFFSNSTNLMLCKPSLTNVDHDRHQIHVDGWTKSTKYGHCLAQDLWYLRRLCHEEPILYTWNANPLWFVWYPTATSHQDHAIDRKCFDCTEMQSW